MELEKVGVTYDDTGFKFVELTYYEYKTKSLKRCVIGINGAKINEFTTGQH